jgi:hypothetical protein
MHSGAAVHRTLSGQIREVGQRLEEMAEEITERQAEIADLIRRRESGYRSLAEFHLPEMSAAAIATSLRELDHRLRAILDEKLDRRRELEGLIPERRSGILRIQERLDALTAELNGIGEERERLARVAFEELERNDRWVRLFEEARRGRARVEASERRYKVALRERAEKTPAYERDPYFSYLRGRGYGTSGAGGSALTRRLDAWVADIVGFERAQANYDFLMELPDHALAARDAARVELDGILEPLTALEKDTFDRLGLTPVLDRGDDLYAEREAMIGRLAEAERGCDQLTDERVSLEDTRGGYYEEAIDELEEHLQGESPETLLARARETGDPRDDAIVEEIVATEAALDEARTALAELSESRAALTRRHKELKKLSWEFEASDWNARRSRFRSDLDMDALLLGFLAGRHSAGHVRGELLSSQSFRAIGAGSSSSSSSSGSFFSGGGFSGGGGFSTGGGFGGGGGGGFSTGGGF